MTPPFLDTNIFLRHLLADEPTHSPAARRLLAAVEQGQLAAWTSAQVVAEVVFVLGNRKTYNKSREFIRDTLLPLLELPGLKLANKRLYRRVFALYAAWPKLSYVDAYHAALVEQQSPPELYSFDNDFDAIPTVTRLDPLTRT